MGALPGAAPRGASIPTGCAGLVYVDEPLPGYNLDRFTAFSPDNPFVYWWFAFNSQPHVPALMWAGKEAELVDYFLTAMCADPTTPTPPRTRPNTCAACSKPGGLHGSFGWYRDVHATADQIRAATATKIARAGARDQRPVRPPGRRPADGARRRGRHRVTIPACGHLCAEEKPAEMAEAILAFTARIGHRA